MTKANNIKKLRNAREVTLEELAEKTGISTSFLSRIEGGKRGLSLENAILIARALGVPVRDLDERFSGVLPVSQDELTSLDQEFMSGLPKLSEDSKKSLLEMMRTLRSLEENASSR